MLEEPQDPISVVSDPLERFEVLRTSDPDILRHVALTIFGAGVGLVAAGFEARASFARVSGLTLTFAAINSEIGLDYPETDYYRFQFGLCGKACTLVGQKSTVIDDRAACVTSPGHAARMTCDGGHARLTLRIDASAVTRKLGALLGALPTRPPELDPSLDMTTPLSQGFLYAVNSFATIVNSRAATLSSLATAELEQAIIVTALTTCRHGYTRLLESDGSEVGLSEVRLAEDFIEANWHRSISIDELASLTGVGVRTLFRTFKRSRGCSPMQFARLVRLRKARDMLATSNSEASIVGTALACGFLNPGHFSRYYKEAFGELPSQTLARHHARSTV